MSNVNSGAQSNGSIPALTVIISTRNRHDEILPCVQSVLASEGVDFELVVVDQSDSDEGHRAVTRAVSDPRLTWVATKTRGLSISRNIGVATARAPIIAFTDDDCRVAPDWLSQLLSVFAEHPEVALVFGRALRADAGEEGGFAAEFAPEALRTFEHEYPHVLEPWGIGANMAARRDALNAIGPFDPALGAGALFRAGEDADITIRMIAAGHRVAFAPGPRVEHLGVRHGEDASRLMHGYGFGLGATLAKHVRLGTPGAARLLADWVLLQGRRSLGNTLRGRRPSGLGLVAFSLWGVGRACAKSINSQRSVFYEGQA